MMHLQGTLEHHEVTLAQPSCPCSRKTRPGRPLMRRKSQTWTRRFRMLGRWSWRQRMARAVPLSPWPMRVHAWARLCWQGHAGTTILPLFSQDKAGKTIDAEKIPDLDTKVQNAGTVVVEAKNGKGSATLSMAYAGARLGKAVLAGS